MIKAKENETDQKIAFGYRLRHWRRVMFCSASWIAVCVRAVGDLGKHGVAELYVVFVKALDRFVFPELSEAVLF